MRLLTFARHGGERHYNADASAIELKLRARCSESLAPDEHLLRTRSGFWAQGERLCAAFAAGPPPCQATSTFRAPGQRAGDSL